MRAGPLSAQVECSKAGVVCQGRVEFAVGREALRTRERLQLVCRRIEEFLPLEFVAAEPVHGLPSLSLYRPEPTRRKSA